MASAAVVALVAAGHVAFAADDAVAKDKKEAAAPAAGQQKPQEVPEDVKKALREALEHAGQAFLPVGKKFGCDNFVSGRFVDPQAHIAQLHYIPSSVKDPMQWTKMVTVTIYALPGEAETDVKIEKNLAAGLVAEYKKTGKILDLKSYTNQHGEPGVFLEYTIGDGDKKEHNAGVFVRVGEKAAGFVQLQTRGKTDLSKDDSQKVYEILIPKGTVVQPAKADDASKPPMNIDGDEAKKTPEKK